MVGSALVEVQSPTTFVVGGSLRSATIVQSTVANGSFAIDAPGAERARRALVDLPWTWLEQVHGAEVVTVAEAGSAYGRRADAAATSVDKAVLAVQTADCVPIALVGTDDDGNAVGIGAVHAGWRGLVAGVVERAVEAVADLGAARQVAIIGAHIHPGCYRFDTADAVPLIERYGADVTSVTSDGEPAVDMTAGVIGALEASGVDVGHVHVSCTACDAAFYSHRARGDMGRQVLAVWMHR